MMATYEHKIVPVSLGFNGLDYSFIAEGEKMRDNHMGEMEKQGWEFVCFWEGGEEYIRDSFEDFKLRLIKLAVFKRKIKG